MDFITYEQEGFVGVITINRPKALNALNSGVLDELNACLDAIDLETTRALVLTGAGEKSFVAGADIAEMSTLTKAEGEAFGKKGNDVFRKLETFPIPVIAAVNGFALGGGCEIAMSCDIRICSDNALFGQPEVGLGITPGFGGTQRLARLIGAGKAKEMIYSCTNVKAEEAKAAGADFVGEDELVAKINGGWLDFDVVVATPDMMAIVGRLGRVLGPRNLMPNPKTGTVTMDVAKAVEESKGGKITYRADKAGNVQAIIGKVSFETEKLVENFKAFNDAIQKAKPATAKGTYITNLSITTTQGAGIKVDPNSL